VAFDFHWADNIQAPDDIIEFGVSGDSAPNRRFKYRYQTRGQHLLTLREDSFEGTLDPSWGETDWDIVSTNSYSGNQSLECSDEDGTLVNRFDLSPYQAVTLSFKYRLQNTNNSDNVILYYYANGGFTHIRTLSAAENNVWLYYTDTMKKQGADVSFFKSDFMFHIQGGGMSQTTQKVLMDDFSVTAVAEVTCATAPNPLDQSTGVPLDTTLGWTAGWGATSHELYFGPTPAGLYQGNLVGTETFDPGLLQPGTTYFWRVDEQTSEGLFYGQVWSFTTEVPESLSSQWNIR
jgi:hypothetical protein